LARSLDKNPFLVYCEVKTLISREESGLPAEVPYHAIVNRLQGRRTLPALVPEQIWHPGVDREIAELQEAELAGVHPDGWASAAAWKAALHLWNDSLARARVLLEPLNSTTGMALLGILHRKERDYENAKRLFRLAGDHPAMHGLQVRVAAWLQDVLAQGVPAGLPGEAVRAMTVQGVWNPYLFTDVVAIVENRVGDEEARALLEGLQHLELAAFLRYLEARIGFE
jgi:hypothetical protein